MGQDAEVCPMCKSKDVAEILWGYPANDDAIRRAIKKKKLVLGGCIVTGNDPKWECNSCYNRWGIADEY